MSFTAVVENDTIKLPPGVHLPDGTEVIVKPNLPEGQSEGRPTLFEVFEPFIGCIKDAPADLAENHDHYAHGAPKGIDRL